MTPLLKIIHRPCCEQFFEGKKVVPYIKLLTTRPVALKLILCVHKSTENNVKQNVYVSK